MKIVMHVITESVGMIDGSKKTEFGGMSFPNAKAALSALEAMCLVLGVSYTDAFPYAENLKKSSCAGVSGFFAPMGTTDYALKPFVLITKTR